MSFIRNSSIPIETSRVPVLTLRRHLRDTHENNQMTIFFPTRANATVKNKKTMFLKNEVNSEID